jgi:S1-C subfamily serine protease
MKPSLACLAVLVLVAAVSSQQKTDPTGTQDKPATKEKPVNERFRRGGYLGLFLTEVPQGRTATVRVESVLPGSEAEKKGFKPGDVVHSVDGKRVRNGDDLLKKLWSTARILSGGKRGKHEIVVSRGEEQKRIPVGLDDLDQLPAVGDGAPDFTLRTLDGKADLRLADKLGKKPLVLIFGSFT